MSRKNSIFMQSRSADSPTTVKIHLHWKLSLFWRTNFKNACDLDNYMCESDSRSKCVRHTCNACDLTGMCNCSAYSLVLSFYEEFKSDQVVDIQHIEQVISVVGRRMPVEIIYDQAPRKYALPGDRTHDPSISRLACYLLS
ncbi:hypothetical protein ACF0H5_013719 [Mactra antiquata]